VLSIRRIVVNVALAAAGHLATIRRFMEQNASAIAALHLSAGRDG
jgi:hypothetical protein